MQAQARARFAFSEFLGGRAQRATPERLAVLNAVLDFTDPFSTEELLGKLARVSKLTISRATVFNTLPLITEAGMLRRALINGKALYEARLPEKSSKPRVYIVCSVCGKIRRMDVSSLGVWASTLRPRGFSVDRQETVAYISGVCSQCKNAEKKTKLNNKNNQK